jgi:hypothetical protein
LEFKIDDVPQPLITGVIYSDAWMKGNLTANFDVTPGDHKLEWTYKKYNLDGMSDDLSAEIQFINITGVKRMNKEC